MLLHYIRLAIYNPCNYEKTLFSFQVMLSLTDIQIANAYVSE